LNSPDDPVPNGERYGQLLRISEQFFEIAGGDGMATMGQRPFLPVRFRPTRIEQERRDAWKHDDFNPTKKETEMKHTGGDPRGKGSTNNTNPRLQSGPGFSRGGAIWITLSL